MARAQLRGQTNGGNWWAPAFSAISRCWIRSKSPGIQVRVKGWHSRLHSDAIESLPSPGPTASTQSHQYNSLKIRVTAGLRHNRRPWGGRSEPLTRTQQQDRNWAATKSWRRRHSVWAWGACDLYYRQLKSSSIKPLFRNCDRIEAEQQPGTRSKSPMNLILRISIAEPRCNNPEPCRRSLLSSLASLSIVFSHSTVAGAAGPRLGCDRTEAAEPATRGSGRPTLESFGARPAHVPLTRAVAPGRGRLAPPRGRGRLG